ncbi:MAG: polysaccharide biosynthesis/export family protein [Cellvibrionaceae bacterium]
MIRFIFCLCLLSSLPFWVSAQAPSDETATPVANTDTTALQGEYLLGVGDIVRIQVFGEPDLTMNVQLTELGVFTYPYLGELSIIGRSVADVQKMLTEALDGDFLVDPKVSVTVESYREIFVGGEVSQSGSFPYQPGLTVGKAIFLAGGFTERSSKRRVKVQSEGEEKSKRVSLDYMLKPGDIVTVSRRFF